MGCLTDPPRCDLSNMTDQKGLYVTYAAHHAWVAVNEKGTEAGGAAAVLVKERCAPVPLCTCTLDKPFLFIIYDTDTGEPLIMGRVVDPLMS
jgi:serpin B